MALVKENLRIYASLEGQRPTTPMATPETPPRRQWFTSLFRQIMLGSRCLTQGSTIMMQRPCRSAVLWILVVSGTVISNRAGFGEEKGPTQHLADAKELVKH